jgi:BNR repeat-like domain
MPMRPHRPRIRALRALAILALLTPLAAAPSSRAATPPSGTVTPTAPFTWQGPVATGHNQRYDPQTGEPCGQTDADFCDTVLVLVDPGDFFATSAGGVEFSIGGAVAGSDMDLYVYASDASGTRGALVGASAGPTDEERVSIQNATGYYLVQVVYFDVDPASGYTGRAEFFRRAKFPPDIDKPRGLPDFLASDPELGYRSHSEPHIAQSPLNPNLLVAASKQYNRDPDSLREYEFKIGTYVSFDHGVTWRDLGPLDVCPQEQAPPATWPLENTCYPADDPSRAGTGPEDANDPRPDGDFGEEYITSDVWVDFDDEGNAYAMVLDAPVFPSGAGWGMSFHRWATPSRADIAAGTTWSDRIPINAYPAAATDPNFGFLDDKNTFAVNNAGPDGDGTTGTMVACWTLDEPVTAAEGPQRIVCERSTDGGQTWPGTPQAISPPTQRLVIGADVVADTRDPNTFYVAWTEYLSGIVSGTGTNTIQVAKSTDGGVTWSAPVTASTFVPLPNVFPHQAFRNLTLPIMAVAPTGEVYLTYADYNPLRASTPDEDGMQADVKLVKSLDGGASWTAPVRVNQDETNADQFQQYLRVTPRGQLNVSYFDRRLDQPDLPAHPGNFFIDTFLSRSNDGGATWKDSRVSHDSWDPSINPPISPSGEFIGDYQGMVADNCVASPFVNDTHLANDPTRDPLFDLGKPRSEFQEVFAWLVPNIRKFGGHFKDCVAGPLVQRTTPVPGGSAAGRSARATRATRRALARATGADARALARRAQVITETQPTSTP